MNGKRWPILFLFVALIVFMSASLFLVSLARMPQEPAVELVSFDYEKLDVCPGDFVPFEIIWKVNRPSIMFVTSSHIRSANAEGDTAIPGRMQETGLLPMPLMTFVDDMDAHFDVPDLEPGDYTRVLAVGTLSEDSKPVFVMMPYTVKEDCDPRD